MKQPAVPEHVDIDERLDDRDEDTLELERRGMRYGAIDLTAELYSELDCESSWLGVYE